MSRDSRLAREAAMREASDILDERHRQIAGEGFDSDHDDVWCRGELSAAAACYLMVGGQGPHGERMEQHKWFYPAFSDFWPWHRKWWKPSVSRRENLVKAAALIIADLERMRRKSEASVTAKIAPPPVVFPPYQSAVVLEPAPESITTEDIRKGLVVAFCAGIVLTAVVGGIILAMTGQLAF